MPPGTCELLRSMWARCHLLVRMQTCTCARPQHAAEACMCTQSWAASMTPLSLPPQTPTLDGTKSAAGLDEESPLSAKAEEMTPATSPAATAPKVRGGRKEEVGCGMEAEGEAEGACSLSGGIRFEAAHSRSSTPLYWTGTVAIPITLNTHSLPSRRFPLILSLPSHHRALSLSPSLYTYTRAPLTLSFSHTLLAIQYTLKPSAYSCSR